MTHPGLHSTIFVKVFAPGFIIAALCSFFSRAHAQEIEQWRISASIVATMYEFSAVRARDKYCVVQLQDHRASCMEEFDNLIDDTRKLSKLEYEEMAEPYRKQLQRRLFGLIVFYKYEDN